MQQLVDEATVRLQAVDRLLEGLGVDVTASPSPSPSPAPAPVGTEATDGVSVPVVDANGNAIVQVMSEVSDRYHSVNMASVPANMVSVPAIAAPVIIPQQEAAGAGAAEEPSTGGVVEAEAGVDEVEAAVSSSHSHGKKKRNRKKSDRSQ